MFIIKFLDNLDYEDAKLLYQSFPSSCRKKFTPEVDPQYLQNYREYEVFQQLQRDLQKMKIKNEIIKTEEIKINDSEMSLFDNGKISIPPSSKINNEDVEISSEPINTKDPTKFEDNDDEEDKNVLNTDQKIMQRIIENAIQSEKTMNKYYNKIKPQLTPTKE
jgi:hypothetical protein